MTAQRSMSDEQMLAKYGYDKEPYLHSSGRRYSMNADGFTFAPRTECIPSRDGKKHGVNMTGAGTPPLCFCGWQGKRFTGPILADHLRDVERPPVNPILSAFRDDPEQSLPFKADEWLGGIADFEFNPNTIHCWHGVQVRDARATPDQIEFARAVLTRLATLQAVTS